MKKKLLLFTIFIAFSLQLQAQIVQWAYEVNEFSSQKSARDYAAVQVLGMPNASPVGSQNINAWQPKGSVTDEFIKVSFLNPIVPKHIIIVESYHPGYISKVTAYDSLNHEYEVATFIPHKVNVAGRALHINITKPAFKFRIYAIKIFVKCDINNTVAIDAIGMTTEEKPIDIKKLSGEVVKSDMMAIILSKNVNTAYREMGPLVAPDGKTLYFSRRGDPLNFGGAKDEEDIWYAEWDEKTKMWAPAKNMGAPLNNAEPNFINSISPDGNTILLGNSYLPDGTMEDGVSVSKRTVNGWSAPKRLIIEDDDDKNLSLKVNFFMSNSQKILMMSSQREGDSKGLRDLYVSFLKTDTTWTKPLNLGNIINTKATESAPFLASDDKTLYFTSDGFNGYGNNDIYISRRLDNTWLNWTKPENLGPKVNTVHNESFFTISASGNKVFFTSQVKNGDDIDMYKLVLPEKLKPLPVMLLSGHTLNIKTNEVIPNVKIIFENLTTGVEQGIASSNPITGFFEIILPAGNNYGYLAEKKGFVSVHENINLTVMNKYEERHKDLLLAPIEVGQVIVLNNVFFDFDKYFLQKESYLELNRIVKLLEYNKNMEIELSAHTDSKGSESYNDSLSIKRAEAVFNYLVVASQITQTRIKMKHYGETNPIATNKTAQGRMLNRRVEFKILAK